MNGWLLDTNVISELRKPRPERKVTTFLSAQPLATLHVSEVTLAEIRFGIELTSDPDKRAILRDWLVGRIRPMFAGRILRVSEDVLVSWRLILHEGRKQRYAYTQPDLFIAATALRHGLTVVTRDTTDFTRAGATVLNPWR